MSLFGTTIATLDDLFVHGLKTIYYAERQIAETLPKMIGMATNPELHGAQMVEHYEIAQYGTLIAWARELGREDCAAVLAENLAEEKETDERLTRIAEARVNRAASLQTA